MFTLPYIIASLYPNKPEEEQQKLIDTAFSTIEYYERPWALVKKEDLAKQDVQIGLAKTLFQSQWGYYGVVSQIMHGLNEWIGEMIQEGKTDAETFAFCQRYYAFLGFAHFGRFDRVTQVMLLKNMYLVLACVWDVPIYVNVQQDFENELYLDTMRVDGALFVEAIKQNQTLLGEEGKIQRSVADWIKEFTNFFSGSFETRVDDFFIDNIEISRMNETDQDILRKILTLYYGLDGGFIWREGTDQFDGGFERKTPVTGQTMEEYYLQNLYRVPTMVEWLKNTDDVLAWIYVTQQHEDFMKKLLFILMKKVDMNDSEQTQLLVDFIGRLQKMGLTGIEDVVYFDEQDGKFHWDEQAVLALEPGSPEEGIVEAPVLSQ